MQYEYEYKPTYYNSDFLEWLLFVGEFKTKSAIDQSLSNDQLQA